MTARDNMNELKKWETSNQEHLINIIRAIREIREIANTTRKCTIICTMVDGMKCLSVFNRKGREIAIRPEVVKRCWSG